MFKGLKVVIVVGALAVIAAAAFRLYGARPSTSASAFANIPRQTTTVDRGDVAVTITTTGNIQAGQNVNLGFATNGTVSSVKVQPGDYVLKGQTIATLDNQNALDAIATAQDKVNTEQLALETLTAKPRQVDIDVAQANVKLAQASLNESEINPTDSIQLKIAQLNIQLAQNQVWQAQLSRDLANSKATKQRPLNSTTIDANNKSIDSANTSLAIAQNQLSADQSTSANPGSIDSAKASLLSAQQQLQTLLTGPDANDVKQAQDNLASAQEALAAAQTALSNTVLVAPFDGLVAQVNLSVGQTTSSSQTSSTSASPAVVLLDVSSFYVNVSVDELDIAKVKVGQQVNLVFDALPGHTLTGTVNQISDTPNTGTPVTYTVKVVFKPDGEPLLSTMSSTAYIVYQNAANVVRLPNGYIRQDTTTNQAFASVQQPDGTYQNVPIKLGATNDTYTEITSGLNVGDVVAAPTVAGASGRTGSGGGFGGGPGGAGGLLRGIGG